MKIKRLSCPVCCEAHFPDVTILRETLVAVTTKCIQCPICEEQLSGLDKFTIHLFTHRIVAANPEKLGEKPAAQSEKISTQPEYQCGEKFLQVPLNTAQSINELQNQNQKNYDTTIFIANSASVTCNATANNITSTTVRCDICNITFSDTNILDMHKNLLHTNGFSCHLCHKRFKMQGSLMVHMRVAHYGFGQVIGSGVRGTKANKQDNQHTAIPHTVDNKQWECDVCLKKFTTKYFLKKHKRLHTGEMPYVCGLCGKSFTFQQSYHKHMLYHSEDKPHTCPECGRAFKELSTLHNHQRIHSGERPFACETCGKCFRQRVSYLVHRRIHTGAMPYRCTSCDKRFRYKVSQRTHKCKAQPPGAVVRQFGDLVHRLLQQQTTQTSTNTSETTITMAVNDEPKIMNEVPILSPDEHYSTINEECLKSLLYDTGNVS